MHNGDGAKPEQNIPLFPNHTPPKPCGPSPLSLSKHKPINNVSIPHSHPTANVKAAAAAAALQHSTTALFDWNGLRSFSGLFCHLQRKRGRAVDHADTSRAQKSLLFHPLRRVAAPSCSLPHDFLAKTIKTTVTI